MQQFGKGTVQLLDHLLLGQANVFLAPVTAGMQHPRVEGAFTPGFAPVAGEPVQCVVLDKAALHGAVQRRIERQGNRPGGLHFHGRRDAGELGCDRRQQGIGLGRRHSDDHMAEGAVVVVFRIM
ncbi:hypothetical protein D3C81_1149650 [compost metagenome]